MKGLQNTNKAINLFYAVFGTLPLLITFFLYPIIPDRIPIHYYIDGIINGWGSKNQLFIVPLIILAFVIEQPKLFTLTFNHEQEDKITKYSNYFFLIILNILVYVTLPLIILAFVIEQPKLFTLTFNHEQEDKITKYSNYFFLIILNILVYVTLYISINYETCLDKFNFYNFFSGSLSLIFAFIGNYIPYSKTSSSFSIKTKCTLKSELIWKKVHKFCGLLWLSGGIVFFPIFIFSNGYYLLFITLLMLLIFIIAPIIYIRYLNKKIINNKLLKKHKTVHQFH